ncbi:MAG: MBL fold metallo-hydrolase [Candidatus Jorgensenbacteria bacterium]|nr:MBL fold metallo-hydrolase [Candidatus Jorgensenbacteria bacterium]
MIDEIYEYITKHKERVTILIIGLAAANALVFLEIISANAVSSDLRVHFLDVWQGDSELIELPGGVDVLVDGGPPNGRATREIASVLGPTDRYIDLVSISHPQLDHFGGIVDVIKQYRVGAFIWNGRREGAPSAFNDLEKKLKEQNIQIITLIAGDKIRYKNSVIDVLWPTEQALAGKDLNDTGLVLKLESNKTKALFTGDNGVKPEAFLASVNVGKIDVLKVPHHGSKYSSSASLLNAIQPLISAIEVGKNSYGHPTEETLSRLKSAGSKIFRTDQDGTVTLVANGKTIKVFKK